MKIRTLIVDDEALARERIRTLVEQDADLEIVGECSNGEEAVAAIETESPDLLFLDVQMPGLDGFGVLESIDTGAVPAVVFVTAYDQYALKAFEHHALDYLLKPFDGDRFARTLERAKARFADRGNRDLRERLDGLLAGLERRGLSRLVVRDAGKISFLRVEEIRWIEAQGNYVKLHAAGESPMVRRSLKDLESRLDPTRFVRIHRSILVNLDRVRELTPLAHGEYRVVLDDGTELTSNRSFRQRLDDLEL